MNCEQLPDLSMSGFIFLKKFPKVYLVLQTVFVLNVPPVLSNFSEVPLKYGMAITHTDLLSSFSFFVLCLGFLLITVHEFPRIRVGCQLHLHQIELCPVVLLIVAQFASCTSLRQWLGQVLYCREVSANRVPPVGQFGRWYLNSCRNVAFRVADSGKWNCSRCRAEIRVLENKLTDAQIQNEELKRRNKALEEQFLLTGNGKEFGKRDTVTVRSGSEKCSVLGDSEV